MMLALGACKPDASTEATEVKDAGAIGLPGRPSPLTLPTCDVLLPADLRDLTLNGFTMKEERGCPTCGPVCMLRSAATPDVSVSVAYDCQPGYAGADVRALLEPMLNAGGEEVSALGRAAARRNPVQGMTQVVAWDDDAPCVVVVTWLGDDPDRAMDVARLAVTAHQGVEGAADAGTALPRLEGDSPLGDAPLEPLDTLTRPRAGTTDVLSAPAGSRAQPSVAPAVVPPPPRPRVTAPVGAGPAPGSVAPSRPPTGLAPGVTPAPPVTPPRPASTPPRNVGVPSAPTTVTPVPTTVTPAPTTVTPAPKPTTPAPTTVTPVPTSVPTAPTTVTPVPKPTTPAPTTVTPAPKPTTPEPTVVTPAPTTAQPAPTTAQPAPTSEPKPETPAPTSAPKPATPAPTTVTPAPTSALKPATPAPTTVTPAPNP
ncbi:hypothetical protein D7V93_25725 [Corallococcus llansteffanensis]|uniref:Uncharacterized protein n=2 Tax=Corallococcus llansteffanensis TaxID=2316731 RepID=A0A3A8PDB8_9BACT|nr:hypothetical protein D7V93_25725 [Corallococcus llansteffanensis]